MKKCSFILVLLLAVVACYFGCKKPEETGTIYGTVTDYATGEPVKNASVKLRPSGETTQTGADGTYSFPDIEPGEYSLFLSRADYSSLDDDYIILLAAGKNIRRDVQMKQTIAFLQISDAEGDTLLFLDFGADQSVISKSFNIFNKGTNSLNCKLTSNCSWISSVSPDSCFLIPGQTMPIVVTINRDNLAAGHNSTFLHITSANAGNELEIRAIGIYEAEVTTADVSNITSSTATCGGNVTNDGGGEVSERGVCWALTQSPSLEIGNHLSMGSGNGSFSGTITGLAPNTPYYVRAYATNVRGTSYGELKMFNTSDGLPVVSTTVPTNVLAATATSGGNVTSNGGFVVTARGVCWNTTGYPDINDTHTTNGTGNGSFTSNMTGLELGTTYHVRAYATNERGTAYGADKAFTTSNGLPIVNNTTATNITATSAVLTCNVTQDYGSNITERGFCWSTNQYPTINDSHIGVGTGTGTFSGSAINLLRNTTYYVRAYARNSYGLNYGPQCVFTTLTGKPTVTTTSPYLNGTTAVTGGNVSSDGGYVVTARGICYGTTPYPDLNNSAHTTDGTGTGYYSSQFTAADAATTTYYIRAYATNENGTSYGEQKTVGPYDCLPSFEYGGHTYKVAPDPGNFMFWGDAYDYCTNLSLYGHSNWSMPTKEQLTQMYADRDRIGGFNCANSTSSRYWSATSAYTSCYYFISFYSGQISYGSGSAYRVRPIRRDD